MRTRRAALGGGELSALVVAIRCERLRGRSTAYPQRGRRGKAGHLIHRVVTSEHGKGLALLHAAAVRAGSRGFWPIAVVVLVTALAILTVVAHLSMC